MDRDDENGRRYQPKGRAMNITHTRKAVGAAIAGAAAPALLSSVREPRR
jgi:hypothetical protein